MSDLGNYLKIRYGLPPSEPDDDQLRKIIKEITYFVEIHAREPNDSELGDIVHRHCPRAGHWKYASDVNVELRRQISMLAAQARK